MANPNPIAKKPVGAVEIVNRVRAALNKAFDHAEQKAGKSIPDILSDEFLANPLKFLEVTAKFLPKDVMINVESRQPSQRMSDDELADIVSSRAKALRDMLYDHQSVDVAPKIIDVTPVRTDSE